MTAQVPQLKTENKGFTLIELLVTIAIIAIISVVAVALFGNIQQNARDSKRKADLEAIANALEVNKTDTGYQKIANTQFGGSKMPGQSQPVSGSNYKTAVDPQNFPYCATTSTTSDAATSGWAIYSDVVAGTGGTCPSSYAAISSGASVPNTDSSRYKICTLLESGAVFCRGNVQ